MLTFEQAVLINDCFYSGVDVHFKVDGNDYNLFAKPDKLLAGTLQVNCEMDFDIDGIQIVGGNGGSLVLSMSGGNSGFIFTLAATDDYNDGEEADE